MRVAIGVTSKPFIMVKVVLSGNLLAVNAGVQADLHLARRSRAKEKASEEAGAGLACFGVEGPP